LSSAARRRASWFVSLMLSGQSFMPRMIGTEAGLCYPVEYGQDGYLGLIAARRPLIAAGGKIEHSAVRSENSPSEQPRRHDRLEDCLRGSRPSAGRANDHVPRVVLGFGVHQPNLPL